MTNSAPAALGPYSQAIESEDGRNIYISGQIPLKPGNTEILTKDFNAQATQVFENIFEIVKAANCRPSDIAKLTIFLVDLTNFEKLNQIMANYFDEPFPARSTIQVAALPKGVLIEIDAIISK